MLLFTLTEFSALNTERCKPHYTNLISGNKRYIVIYYDFETLTIPVYGPVNNPNLPSSRTDSYQIHVPCAFSITVCCIWSEYQPKTIYFSHHDPETVIDEFMECINTIRAEVEAVKDTKSFKIDMTYADEVAFEVATHCYMCFKPFDESHRGFKKCRDHDHFKEFQNYRGPAHARCNRGFWYRNRKIPCVAHNSSNFDLHLIIHKLIKTATKPPNAIPETIERFKSFATDDFIFLDSYNFLPTSMTNLVDSLVTEAQPNNNPFKVLSREINDSEKEELLKRKGVFCYDYASDFTKFMDTALPPKEAFYNTLTQEHIKQEDYDHAQNVFITFNCSNLLDYLHLYVKTDTILLADCFESFRNLAITSFGLDPLYYISLPSYGRDAMLKVTRAEIGLISDISMWQMINRGIRGGKYSHLFCPTHNVIMPTT